MQEWPNWTLTMQERQTRAKKGPGEHHREKGEPPRTRQHPEQTHHQLSASKPRELACHPHSETPFNPAPAVAASRPPFMPLRGIG